MAPDFGLFLSFCFFFVSFFRRLCSQSISFGIELLGRFNLPGLTIRGMETFETDPVTAGRSGLTNGPNFNPMITRAFGYDRGTLRSAFAMSAIDLAKLGAVRAENNHANIHAALLNYEAKKLIGRQIDLESVSLAAGKLSLDRLFEFEGLCSGWRILSWDISRPRW